MTTLPNSVFSDVIDIYDTVTRTWTRVTLSKARMYPMTTIVGKKMIILGGIERFGYVNGNISAFFSKKVDIYDSETNTWISSEVPEPRGGSGAISWLESAYFIWGTSSNSSNSFDYTKINVYNPNSNAWSNLSFPNTVIPRTAQTASINNKIFIVGGNSNLIPSNKIDILTLPPTSTKDYNLSKIELSTYPNPTKDIVFLKFRSDVQSNSHITLSNFNGQLLKDKDVKIYTGENTIEMSCQDLPNGIYWLNIKSDKSIGTTLFVKK